MKRAFRAFKKAPFPAIMTIICLALFIAVYWFVTQTAAEPYYCLGLIFAIPSLCFATVTYLTVKDRMKTISSISVTAVLVVVLGLAFSLLFAYIAVDAATTVTTDIDRYERVLKLSSLPDYLLEDCFPEKIPEDAEDIEFSYHPAFMQGGEDITLKFKADPDDIEGYAEEFSKKAKWIGKEGDGKAGEYGIFTGTFSAFDYPDAGLPKTFTIYVIFSKPYKPDDWNHGERSLAAISEEDNEILFLASKW